jgi:hypothetical protein
MRVPSVEGAAPVSVPDSSLKSPPNAIGTVPSICPDVRCLDIKTAHSGHLGQRDCREIRCRLISVVYWRCGAGLKRHSQVTEGAARQRVANIHSGPVLV